MSTVIGKVRKRAIAYLIAFIIELAIFLAAVNYPVPSSELQALQEEARRIASYGTNQTLSGLASVIFTNNIKVALQEFIPVYGAFVFALVIFTTGQVLQVAAGSTSLPSSIVAVALFLFPFSFVELMSYSVAVVSGSALLINAIRRKLREGFAVFAVEVSISILLLLVAAFMEALTIFNPLIGFLFWVPIGLLAYFLRKRKQTI